MRPTRRDFLRHLGIGAGVVLLAACSQPAAAPAPTPAPAQSGGTGGTGSTGGAAGAPPAAAQSGGATTAGSKSNGSKLTVWGWQSFTPEGDRALGDQMKEWGQANKTEVEYVVVENSQFMQKLAAAVEAKAAPDVYMLTAAADVLDYGGGQPLVGGAPELRGDLQPS